MKANHMLWTREGTPVSASHGDKHSSGSAAGIAVAGEKIKPCHQQRKNKYTQQGLLLDLNGFQSPGILDATVLGLRSLSAGMSKDRAGRDMAWLPS